MEKSSPTNKRDFWTLIASLVIIGLSVAWSVGNGALSVELTSYENLTWYLIRSSGIVGYVLLLASCVWGLLLSSQVAKDWSPGPVSLTMHSTISWLALLLSLVHGLLLLLDKYFTYALDNIFIPFTGPYRPEAVGLGTLAFWFMVAISLSFPLKKFIGQKSWKLLHYTSYSAFGLASLHGLFAGTDGEFLGFRLLIGFGVLLVVLLLGIRLGRDSGKAVAVSAMPTRPTKGKS